MLKLVAGLVAGATLLTVGTVSAFASSQGNHFGICPNTRVCDTTNCSAQCYVDVDGDGVCDNFGTRCNGGYYVDVDNDGICDNQGQNYVDADNDGVCDNFGTGSNGNGNGQNYVDADNDGVCDNQGTNCNGGGQGHHGNGYRGGHHG